MSRPARTVPLAPRTQSRRSGRITDVDFGHLRTLGHKSVTLQRAVASDIARLWGIAEQSMPAHFAAVDVEPTAQPAVSPEFSMAISALCGQFGFGTHIAIVLLAAH